MKIHPFERYMQSHKRLPSLQYRLNDATILTLTFSRGYVQLTVTAVGNRHFKQEIWIKTKVWHRLLQAVQRPSAMMDQNFDCYRAQAEYYLQEREHQEALRAMKRETTLEAKAEAQRRRYAAARRRAQKRQSAP